MSYMSVKDVESPKYSRYTLEESPETSKHKADQKPVQRKNMPFMKLFFVVNLAKITSAGLLGLTKDMLSNRDVAVFEFAFFRSISNMIISAILIKYRLNKPLWGGFPREFRGTMAIRSFCGAIDFLCITTAPKYLPLGI